MPVNSRQKGARGEREFASLLRQYGWSEARRGVQYSGRTGAADVVGVPNVHWEVKRNERLNQMDAYDQAKRDARDGELPVVAWRKNDCPWMVTLSADDFLVILREWVNGRGE